MTDGGFLSDDYKPTQPIICFNCWKHIGSKEYERGQHEIVLCEKCAKPMLNCVEFIKSMDLSGEDIQKYMTKIINQFKEGFYKE